MPLLDQGPELARKQKPLHWFCAGFVPTLAHRTAAQIVLLEEPEEETGGKDSIAGKYWRKQSPQGYMTAFTLKAF